MSDQAIHPTVDPYVMADRPRTLTNTLDIADHHELDAVERVITDLRSQQLRPDTPSVDRFRDVHRHLFGDLYEWAGEYRTVDLYLPDARAGRPVTFAPVEQIDPLVDQVFETVANAAASTDRFDLDALATRTGQLTGALARIHPFRHGNGRTIRHTLNDFADQHGHRIDFNRADRAEWRVAADEAYRGNTTPMADLTRSLDGRRLAVEHLAVTVEEWARLHTVTDPDPTQRRRTEELARVIADDAHARAISAQHLLRGEPTLDTGLEAQRMALWPAEPTRGIAHDERDLHLKFDQSGRTLYIGPQTEPYAAAQERTEWTDRVADIAGDPDAGQHRDQEEVAAMWESYATRYPDDADLGPLGEAATLDQELDRDELIVALSGLREAELRGLTDEELTASAGRAFDELEAVPGADRRTLDALGADPADHVSALRARVGVEAHQRAARSRVVASLDAGEIPERLTAQFGQAPSGAGEYARWRDQVITAESHRLTGRALPLELSPTDRSAARTR